MNNIVFQHEKFSVSFVSGRYYVSYGVANVGNPKGYAVLALAKSFIAKQIKMM